MDIIHDGPGMPITRVFINQWKARLCYVFTMWKHGVITTVNFIALVNGQLLGLTLCREGEREMEKMESDVC